MAQTAAERTEYNRRWREANPDKVAAWRPGQNEKARNLYLERRRELVQAYGGQCMCPGCDEDDYPFLTLDHVDGIPNDHKRPNGKRAAGSTIVHRLWNAWKASGVIDERMTVLCYNCNCARAVNNGVCPHEEVTPQNAD